MHPLRKVNVVFLQVCYVLREIDEDMWCFGSSILVLERIAYYRA